MDLDKLFLKFLTQTASEQDLQQLESLLTKHPEQRAVLEKLKLYWDQKHIQEHTPNEDVIWRKLQEKTHHIPVESSVKRHFNYTKVYQYAAVFIILMLSVALFWTTKKDLHEDKEVKIVYVTKQNPVRLKRTLILPDGSKVHLNSESKITYPERFRQRRSIKLIGEAYFEVVPDKLHPFRVECLNTSTTVEGTSFNVRGYSDEETVKVSLVEGKVSVDFDEHGQISSYLLEPMQEAIYHRTSGEVEIDLFNVLETTSWKSGVLYFKNASYEQVKSRIERWYGVELKLSNAINPIWNISGEFHNETLQNVMEIISHAENFEFEINESQVEITI